MQWGVFAVECDAVRRRMAPPSLRPWKFDESSYPTATLRRDFQVSKGLIEE